MTFKTSHTQPVSDQDPRRLRQMKVQLASAGLILAGGLIAYLELGVLVGGGLMLAGLALLLLTPRI